MLRFRFRFLSTLNYSVPLAANATAVSKDECREFMSVFPGMGFAADVVALSDFYNFISTFRFGSRFNREDEKV